jgi:hypothetical protein
MLSQSPGSLPGGNVEEWMLPAAHGMASGELELDIPHTGDVHHFSRPAHDQSLLYSDISDWLAASTPMAPCSDPESLITESVAHSALILTRSGSHLARRRSPERDGLNWLKVMQRAMHNQRYLASKRACSGQALSGTSSRRHQQVIVPEVSPSTGLPASGSRVASRPAQQTWCSQDPN